MRSFRHFAATLAVTLGLMAGPAAAQLQFLSNASLVQYGGLGAPQSRVNDPWIASVAAPPWEGLADLTIGELKAGALAGIEGVANTYSSFQFVIFNSSPVNAIALPSLSMHFDAMLSITGDADAGRAFTTVHGIAIMNMSGVGHLARLDHQIVEQCDALHLDCRSNVDTRPVLQGGGTVSVVSATPSFVEATLWLPAFTLAPMGSAQFFFQLQAIAINELGWIAAVDATNSAQLSWQLPAGVTLASDRPLSWVTTVPEPGTSTLALLGVAALAMAVRRRRMND